MCEDFAGKSVNVVSIWALFFNKQYVVILKKNKTEHITVFKENYREDHTVSVLVENNLRECRSVKKIDFIEMGSTNHGLPTNWPTTTDQPINRPPTNKTTNPKITNPTTKFYFKDFMIKSYLFSRIQTAAEM